jgi:vacuolar-type H+-ATPase subunit I/STV1
MQDKQLTTEQSLDLIARMLENTRRNFNTRGGAMFLIWGYTVIAVTLAVYFAFMAVKSYDVMWLWWALPVIGGIATWLYLRRNAKSVYTQLDRNVWAVWTAFSAATFVCMVFGFLPGELFADHPPFPILLLIGLMISLATAITGLMIRFRPVTVAGFAGIVLAFLMWIFRGMEQLLIFAALMLVVQVIPGHMLNAYCKREAREAQNGRAE